MTESFILMALGIGIGYSITLWPRRPRATTVAAMGPNTDMLQHSVAHEAVSTEGSKTGSVVGSGEATPASAKYIAEQVLESGAEVVMFVNNAKNLIVLDAKTGEVVPATRRLQHNEHHDAEIRLNGEGEPILVDTKTKEDMVQHGKTADGFYDSTRISTRIAHARIIYFCEYTGSHCICTWSGGDHYVRCRRS